MIQYWFEKHRELQARRAEEGFDGFTLIELLIVIVVLGILAAVVIFALGGVTGQSVAAACNSDAKSVETAVEAYHAAPGNDTNAWPAAMSDLTGTAFGGPFLRQAPTSTHYVVLLGDGATNDKAGDLTTEGGVYIAPSGKGLADSANYDVKDGSFANPCDDPAFAS